MGGRRSPSLARQDRDRCDRCREVRSARLPVGAKKDVSEAVILTMYEARAEFEENLEKGDEETRQSSHGRMRTRQGDGLRMKLSGAWNAGKHYSEVIMDSRGRTRERAGREGRKEGRDQGTSPTMHTTIRVEVPRSK